MSNRNVKNTKTTHNSRSTSKPTPHHNVNHTHLTFAVALPAKQIQQPKKSPKQNNRRKKKVYQDDSSSSDDSEPLPLPKASKKKSPVKQRAVVSMDYKSLVDQVYAGPTFNNAPAPSSLPLPPVFNARGSPTLLPHHVINTAFEMEQTNLALSEIQRGLRSMLKIES
ncbi:hypothetical protein BY458DRAFT_502136 [Sporodiniella umbellata]|nr:hypothetical protein BY458DRAFT_502136 [Sporodiniella umbellata]